MAGVCANVFNVGGVSTACGVISLGSNLGINAQGRKKKDMGRSETDSPEFTNLILSVKSTIYILLAVWGGVVLHYLYRDPRDPVVWVGTGFITVLFFLLWLVHMRQLLFPRIIIPFAMLAIVTYLASDDLGLHDTVIIAYPISILMGALFLGRRGAVILTLAALGSLCVLYYGEVTGYLINPVSEHTKSSELFDLGIILLGGLGLVWSLMSSNVRMIDRARKSERDMASAYAKLNKAQRVAHVGSWERDLVYGREVWSEEMLRIFEFPPDGGAPSRKAFMDRVHEEDREWLRDVRSAAFTALAPSGFVYRLVLPEGRIKHVQERIQTTLDEKGVPVRVVGTLQDITDRKIQEEERSQLEAQLVQSQKMESVGRLAGGVAHDFNNLLTAILGYSEIALLRSDPSDIPLREAVNQIRKAGERAKDLTRQLLAFGRKQTLEIRPLNLNDTVKNIEKMLRRLIGEDIEICTALSGDAALVKADPTQVEQIMMNLAVNARDAMPRGGTLTIETRNLFLDDDYVARYPEVHAGAYVMLTVMDTGCGMTAETQSLIFEPFFTTKDPGKGTGLGLAMVYGIVKQHNGHITVQSELGQGSVFRIFLPVAPESHEMEEEPLHFVAPASGMETILVVEDDVPIRQLTLDMLANLGYTVFAASHVQDALRIAAECEGLDLIVTDVVMPDLNGREVYEQVTAMHPRVKVLYISGYTSETIAHHGIVDKHVHFLQKPFDIRSLSYKVRDALEK